MKESIVIQCEQDIDDTYSEDQYINEVDDSDSNTSSDEYSDDSYDDILNQDYIGETVTEEYVENKSEKNGALQNGDILDKKEFGQFQLPKQPDLTSIDIELQSQRILLLGNYQRFVNNFMSINTDYDRLLLVHSTGVGKTISALSTAFLAVKQLGYPINVFVLGFSKSVFKKELLSRPEFGIVTQEDIDNLRSVNEIAMKYGTRQSIAQLKHIKRVLNSKLTHSSNVHVNFIGYKALVKRLFIKLNPSISLEELSSLEAIRRALDRGFIKENMQFTQMLDNSFIICDEIHNLYNSLEMNSWGIVLKYMIDRQPCKCIFASATPVNNSPHKVVQVINLLTPNKYFKIQEIFTGNNLSKDGEKILMSAFANKISYIMDKSPESYPSMSFTGTTIQGAPYLKFIRCPISKLHINTIRYMEKMYSESGQDITDGIDDEDIIDNGDVDKYIEEEDLSNSLSLEGIHRYLNDMVFPNPDNEDVGTWLRKDISRTLMNANDKYLREKGIILSKSRDCSLTISGDILLEENISQYSAKYAEMLSILRKLCVEDKGKILVYHNFVQMSGTCIVSEILKVNGYVEYGEPPLQNSRCAKCYNQYKGHTKDHPFVALSFITITGNTNKSKLDIALDMFNSSANNDGSLCKVLLGSRAIKEAYDFKAVRNVIVLHQPENISTLIQILGRAVRRGSHLGLKPEFRHVDVFILVSSFGKSKELTFEERKWVFKLDIYQRIQKINNMLLQSAVDYDINYDINFNEGRSSGLYEITPWRPKKLATCKDLSTFRAYYYSDEISYTKYLIKRCFLELSPVWTAETLWETILDPPFRTDRNTSKLSPHSFTIALTYVVYKDSNIVDTGMSAKDIDTMRFLTTDDSKYIYKNKIPYVIVHTGDIYVLTAYEQKKKPIVDYDFMSVDMSKDVFISVSNYINENKESQFNTMLRRFVRNVANTKIEFLDSVLVDYEENFHKEFIEFIIQYVNEWLRGKREREENHDVYIKMLYFYNKFRCITFANHMTPYVSHIYSKLVTSTTISSYTSTESSDINKYEDELMTSLEDEYASEVNGYKIHYHHYYEVLPKLKPAKKPKDYMLPTGHIFGTQYRVFNPDTNSWDSKPIIAWSNAIYKYSYKDAGEIAGYLDKDKSGVHISFKIRINTKQKKNITDKRKEITGVTCSNMSKQDIDYICKKLNIDVNKADKKKCICKRIKIALIKMELAERKKRSNNRYFYFYWENKG